MIYFKMSVLMSIGPIIWGIVLHVNGCVFDKFSIM